MQELFDEKRAIRRKRRRVLVIATIIQVSAVAFFIKTFAGWDIRGMLGSIGVYLIVSGETRSIEESLNAKEREVDELIKQVKDARPKKMGRDWQDRLAEVGGWNRKTGE